MQGESMTPSGANGHIGKREDLLVHEREPFNSEPSSAALAEHLITPVETFYTRNHGVVPTVDASTWRLGVDGLVQHPMTLSLEDLRSRWREHTVVATLQCAGNRRAGLMAVRDIPGEAPWRDGATSTAEWTGIRLADVLRDAGVSVDEGHVAFAAPDEAQDAHPPQGYGSSIPVKKALADEVLLTWAMNGESLLPVHGAPVRVIVPGYIGARSVKWLRRITVQRQPSDNYFQAVAYRLQPADADPSAGAAGMPLGAVALNSAILQPTDGEQVPAGPTTVRGYAFAGGGRRVMRVDVSCDGGASWTQADLGVDAGRWAWRLWSATVDARAGEVHLVARAWDDSAALQPADAADLWNPKGYVNNSWPQVEVHASDRS
jgi:sulfite oxidase